MVTSEREINKNLFMEETYSKVIKVLLEGLHIISTYLSYAQQVSRRIGKWKTVELDFTAIVKYDLK